MRAAAEQAVQTLRRQILSGSIPPGAHLRAADLAERLNVSRTPIREALSRLCAEGLVELQPNRGARVASWTDDQLREIFELRLRLEPYAVRQAVPRLTPVQHGQLEGLANEMLRIGRPGRGQRLDDLVELNRKFHDQFVTAAAMPQLSDAIRAVTHRAVVHQNFHDYGAAALTRSLHHHQELAAAARAGDADWAEAIMRAHLCNARAAMFANQSIGEPS